MTDLPDNLTRGQFFDRYTGLIMELHERGPEFQEDAKAFSDWVERAHSLDLDTFSDEDRSWFDEKYKKFHKDKIVPLLPGYREKMNELSMLDQAVLAKPVLKPVIKKPSK
jgi:hypothetical protein